MFHWQLIEGYSLVSFIGSLILLVLYRKRGGWQTFELIKHKEAERSYGHGDKVLDHQDPYLGHACRSCLSAHFRTGVIGEDLAL